MFGWRKDLPDFRDYTAESLTRKKGLEKAGVINHSPVSSVDLRRWCTPVVNQGTLGSCTAHAGCAMYEFFEKKVHGRSIPKSRLFLYKTTRNLLKESGDTGAFLRTTMQAMALFGICPEKYWPYNASQYDQEPSSFCYNYAQNYQALTYFRLDTPGLAKDRLLKRIKEYLSREYVIQFGFTVYDVINEMDGDVIPFPGVSNQMMGGHAVLAVGYDDSRKALLIKNSWGPQWANRGYGWLPYEYVLRGLAEDFWTMTAAEWLDTGIFK